MNIPKPGETIGWNMTATAANGYCEYARIRQCEQGIGTAIEQCIIFRTAYENLGWTVTKEEVVQTYESWLLQTRCGPVSLSTGVR